MAPNKISFTEGKINVPDNPIIPFIEGDGIGVDIWPASKHVFDYAVEKAYGGKTKIELKVVLAGEKAYASKGNWRHEVTLDVFSEY